MCGRDASVCRWYADFPARAGPEGRRAMTKVLQNKLYDTVTQLQRVCGQPSRDTRRGRSTAGIDTARPRFETSEKLLREFSLSRAICAPPTVFPSLRAHKPDPAWLTVHPNLAGEMLE
jgi:hypothetical protein